MQGTLKKNMRYTEIQYTTFEVIDRKVVLNEKVESLVIYGNAKKETALKYIAKIYPKIQNIVVLNCRPIIKVYQMNLEQFIKQATLIKEIK